MAECGKFETAKGCVDACMEMNKYLLKGFNDRVQCKDSMSRYDGILEKPAHRQPVIEAAHAQATSYIGSPSTGNQL